MALTPEQQTAFDETRAAMTRRLRDGYCYTDSMLKRLSLFELLNLLMLELFRSFHSDVGCAVNGKDQHAVELLMPYDRKVHVLHREKS